MGYKHYTEIDMSADGSTGIVEFKDERGFVAKGEGLVIVSWSGVTGTKDGTIDCKLYYPSNTANTENHQPISLTPVTVDTASGANRWLIDNKIEKFEIAYTENSITAGTLKITTIVE